MKLREKTGGFIGEFKTFISRGNVIDMAVGVIIGGAFGQISASLVNDVIMPLISLLTGGIHFEDWQFTLKEAVYEGPDLVADAVSIHYGNFLSAVLNFFIVAFAIFLLLKVMNTAAAKAARRKKEAAEAVKAAEADKPPTREELLLTEIRDLLKDSGVPGQRKEPGSPEQGGQKRKRR